MLRGCAEGLLFQMKFGQFKAILTQRFALSIVGIALASGWIGFAGEHSLERSQKKTPQKYSSRIYQNEHGEVEVAYELLEKRFLLPNTKIDVLYGRDLDADALPDAWFLVGADGSVQSFDRPSATRDGWDVASELFSSHLIEERSARTMLGHATFTHLTMTGANRESSIRRLARMRMDLEELEIRAERIRAKNPNHPSLAQQYKLISQGWNYLSETIQNRETRNEILFATGDVVTLLIGGAIVKGVLIPLKWMTPKFVTEFAEQFYSRFVQGTVERAEAAMAKFRKGSGEAAVREGESELVRLTIAQRIGLQIRGMTARAAVAQRLSLAASKTLSGLKGGLQQWKYIAGTEALQLGAEIFTNRDTLFSANPIVLGQNIATNKDLLQNMGYMTVETYDAAVISSMTESIPKRMALCGLLSTVNSTLTSYYVKGETDLKRMALDTSWEVFVGNAQVQLDFFALATFEKMAVAQNNPKLKLVGYAVVLVDQLGGYLGYAALTKMYERGKARNGQAPATPEIRVEFAPIFAP